MAGETNGAIALESTEHVPIAQLSPEIAAPATRAIRAVVTLTWPYSSATGSVAFLLSEPDFRLRRTRGQVRVRFSGSSAKAVAASGIASGDEVIVCLDGVEWISDDATVVTPGRGIEYELKFSERLLLQFTQQDSEEVKKIDLDHPPLAEPVVAPARIPSPEPEQPLLPTITPSINRTIIGTKIGDEWSSPAFIKRARTSYGSLFEPEYDIFAEEDGSIPGKGRKRTRLSSTWRYASRSPTPEADEPEVESMDTSPEPAPRPAPTMMDEGCQTVDFGNNDATEDVAQALADLSRQATNVGGAAYPIPNGSASSGQPQLFHTSPTNQISATDLPIIRTKALSQESEAPEVELEIPKSPRLQPVPSDSLSLVSPLLSTKRNIFSQSSGDVPVENADPILGYESANARNGSSAAEHVEHQQLFGEPGATHANGDVSVELEEEEDIYTASPAGRREERPDLDHPGFQVLEIANDGIGIPIFEGQLASEDQYGHWQSAGAYLSNAASPRNEISMEGTHGDRFYNDEGVHEDEEPLGNSVEGPNSEYPELEDGPLVQVPSVWGPGSVAYPEPPNSSDHTIPYSREPPPSSAISRSQSFQSAVDLTESGDDADPDGQLQNSGDEYDDSVDAESEEAVYRRQGAVLGQPDDHSDDGDFEEEDFDGVQASTRQNEQYEDADAEADEEGEYEEEEIYAKMPVAFGSDQDDEAQIEGYDEDDEGSFDEDEENYNEEDLEDDELPEPRVRSAPEVIDLLSSDEEDETPSKAPAPTTNSQGSSPHKHVHDPQMSEDKSDSSDFESELEDEEPLSYTERLEVETSIPGLEAEYSSSEVDEHEDEDAVYEDKLPPDTVSLHGESDSENDSSEDLDQESDAQSDEGEEEDAIDRPPVTVFPQDSASANGVIKNLDVQVDAEAAEVGSNMDDGEQLQLPQESESGGMEVESPAQSRARDHSLPQSSPARPSLFSQMFDGAHDEPRFGASYRSMSKEEGTLPSSILLQKVFSEGPIDQISKQDNQQLLTPEDTQISRKTVSLENSFSSTHGIQQPADNSSEKMDIDKDDESRGIQPDEVEAEAADAQTSIETVTFTVEVSGERETADIGNLEGFTHTEKITPIDEVVETSLTSQLEEVHVPERSLEPVEESERLDDSEHDEETTALTEIATKVTVEDHQSATNRNQLQSCDVGENSRPQSRYGDTATEEAELQLGSPRRSTRSTKPTLKAPVNAKENVRPVTPVKPVTVNTMEQVHPASPLKSVGAAKNTKENAKPVTPVKSCGVPPSTSTDNDQSPLVVIDNRATPKGHDASIEFALEASDASSPPQHNLRKAPVADLKLRLTRALRTDFSEFTGLKVLRFHLTQKLDFLAVATTTPPEPQRAKNGPRQYQITFNITDPSIAPSSVTEVQVFRPYKDALPIVKAGDGILLRNFLVMSVQSRAGGPAFALRSTQEDASSWAVFKDDDEVEIRGPPVEYGDAEKNHVMQLKSWYASLDNVAMAKIARANGDRGAAGSAAGKKHSKAL
ncbi:hypothetical protein BKA65DRAFT_555722 [Rhexocercosporidium sp. MPI-PUGE-AT-0058]|nr:hypothetical protein BKA65DRAFT_555722 [Rhexocercosporidium sp. MPI-PUGE-AT-0058]